MYPWQPGATFSNVHRQHHIYTNIQLIFFMMTSSNGNIFRVTGPLCREFTGPGDFPAQRPVTRSFDDFFDLRLNKRLSKQPWGWWFEMPSWSLWRHCNVERCYLSTICIIHAFTVDDSDDGDPTTVRIPIWSPALSTRVYEIRTVISDTLIDNMWGVAHA